MIQINELSSTFITQHFQTNNNNITGTNNVNELLFAQIRTGDKKDVIALKDSCINVYRNSSGNINIKLDSIYILNIEKIAISNFNNTDNFEDILCFHNDTLKVFKSVTDGTLDRNYISLAYFGGDIKKLLSKQVTLDNPPYNLINNPTITTDREDIIFSSQDKLYIYLNTGNAVTHSQTFTFSDDIVDFDLADLNNDGYNDLVVVGQSDDLNPTYYFKVFLNNKNGTISTSETFSITNYVMPNCRIAFGDFNKDGWNDIVMGGRDTVRIFENVRWGSLFSTSNIVIHKYNTPTISLPKKIIVGDFTNQGGLSVLFSGETRTLYELDPNWKYENILRFNPAQQNTNPSPPYLFKQLVLYGQHYRPKIKLFNRGDRDFQKFVIYKKSPNTGNIWALLDSNITGGEYIDYTEAFLEGGSGGSRVNCNYYAKSVDITYNRSINSDTIGYSTHVCIGCQWEEENISFNGKDSSRKSQVVSNSISNFPNPFNPITKINYGVQKDQFVKITVYNNLGQIVNTLVNDYKLAGNYFVEFDGSKHPSGLYYYIMQINEGNIVNKMILIK